MISNIDKVLERGHQLDTLIDKSEKLTDNATKFEKATKSLRKQLWWNNQKVKLVSVLCLSLFAIVS